MPGLSAIRIVLVRTSHPGNIGGSARAMKTMGLERLALVAPRHFPHAEAEAMAAGATDLLAAAAVHPTLEEAIADCVAAVGFSARPRDLSQPVHTVREAAARALERAREGPVALVFGNETNGLSNEELGRCQSIARIPSNPAYGSLNLAAAVQVACYELAMAATPAPALEESARDRATAEDVEGLYAHLERCALESGYLDPERPGRLMLRLRRLFARARLERSEVKVLRGMLEAFENKMRDRQRGNSS